MTPKAILISVFYFVIYFNVSAQVSLTLTPAENAYLSSQAITLTFETTTPLNSGSWVGVFPADAAHGSSQGYMNYQYINEETKREFAFAAPVEAGKYEFRVFDANPEKEIKSIGFTVEPIDPRSISMTINTTDIKPMKRMNLSVATVLKLNPKAWIGVFNIDVATDAHGDYLSYEYLGTQGIVDIELNAPADVGDYEFRLYSEDRGQLIKQLPFRVGDLNLPGIKFELNKTTFDPEEDVVIDYVGHEDLTTRAWLGLFPAQAKEGEYNEYFDYHYLKPITAGQTIFKAPSEKGDYLVRMFYADQGPMLYKSVPFSVTSSLDKTYLESKIKEDGKVILYGIYFDTDKSEIKTESHALIKQIASLLLNDSNLNIRIEGHTDNEGGESYNQRLSEERAKAIRQFLITKHDVPSSQLTTIGHGESKPVENNATAGGRAKNRRVELVKV